MRRTSLLLVLLLIALPFTGQDSTAAPKNPPTPPPRALPAEITTAQTVYLEVNTDVSDFHYKHAYDELRKWNRWKVVADPKDADLILVITSREGRTGIYSTNIGTGQIAMPVTGQYYQLVVLGREKKESLWSTTTGMKMLKSNEAKELIKQLRKRIQASEPK